MKKVDPTVLKETAYIAACTVLLSIIMQVVFVSLHRWDITVLFGNLLGGAASILNFFLMGLTVQKAVLLEEKEAAAKVKTSQMLRMFMLVAVAILGGILKSCFSIVAVLVPMLFPRVGIAFRPLFNKEK